MRTHADYFAGIGGISQKSIERQNIEPSDHVTIPAWVDGLGEDRAGTVTEIETFMDTLLITVRYEKPDILRRMGAVVYENQIIKT